MPEKHLTEASFILFAKQKTAPTKPRLPSSTLEVDEEISEQLTIAQTIIRETQEKALVLEALRSFKPMEPGTQTVFQGRARNYFSDAQLARFLKKTRTAPRTIVLELVHFRHASRRNTAPAILMRVLGAAKIRTRAQLTIDGDEGERVLLEIITLPTKT